MRVDRFYLKNAHRQGSQKLRMRVNRFAPYKTPKSIISNELFHIYSREPDNDLVTGSQSRVLIVRSISSLMAANITSSYRHLKSFI